MRSSSILALLVTALIGAGCAAQQWHPMSGTQASTDRRASDFFACNYNAQYAYNKQQGLGGMLLNLPNSDATMTRADVKIMADNCMTGRGYTK